MDLTREKRLSLGILLAALIVNAIALWPELTIGRISRNDNVSHFTLLEGMVQALEHGENLLDFWSPESSFGFSVFRTYQPLPHVIVTLAYFALGKLVPLMTVFVWIRYLAALLLPLSFFTAARWMGLPPLTGAAAALLSPLIAGADLGRLGVDYRSWLLIGVFPQTVAANLLPVTLGLAFQSIRRGRYLAITGAALGLTCLAHLIYGWMGALTICVVALMPDAEIPRAVRIRRTIMVGAVAMVLTAFELLPLWTDGYFLNHSRIEPAEKWDSYGASQVLQWLFTGGLMDHERIPVLTLLSFIGAGLWFWNSRRGRKAAPAHTFVLLGATFWILIFFGRPAWGLLLVLLGVSPDMHLSRAIAGVQIFLLLLAAIGLSTIWRELARRSNAAFAAAITALLLFPLVQERARFLYMYTFDGHVTTAAYAADRQPLEGAISLVKQRGGRVYAGLLNNWGTAFKVGDAPVASFLSTHQVPAVGFLYYSTSLTSDITPRFDELNSVEYRLFNIRSVMAPAMPRGTSAFLTPVADFGRFRVFDAPGNGYFDLVDVAAAVPITRHTFYDVNDRWLHSDWVEKGQYLWIDLKDEAPPELPRMAADSPLPLTKARAESAGTVQSERQTGDVYQAELEVTRPSFALFKMTWHPNWKAYVDGKPQKTAMLSPGFPGVRVTAGRHEILWRYEPGTWRVKMALSGLLLVMLGIAIEQRGAIRQRVAIEQDRAAAPLPGPMADSGRRPPPVDRKNRARDKSRFR